MLSWWLGTVLGFVIPLLIIGFAMMRNRRDGGSLALLAPGIPLLIVGPVLGGLTAQFVPIWVILLVVAVAIVLFRVFTAMSRQRIRSSYSF